MIAEELVTLGLYIKLKIENYCTKKFVNSSLKSQIHKKSKIRSNEEFRWFQKISNTLLSYNFFNSDIYNCSYLCFKKKFLKKFNKKNLNNLFKDKRITIFKLSPFI